MNDYDLREYKKFMFWCLVGGVAYTIIATIGFVSGNYFIYIFFGILLLMTLAAALGMHLFHYGFHLGDD